MFPDTFDYREAGSIEEAVSLLAESPGDRTNVLAGGHGLIPDMKGGDVAPDVLIDIGGIQDLRGIEQNAPDGPVSIGALTTHAELATAERLATHAPLLQRTASEVADLQIRNVGTVGGNLAEADPEADLPAAVLALDATLHATGPDGTREIPADAFFEGPGETALADDELLTSIDVPANPVGGYVRRTHPARGYAMVGVAAALELDAGEVAAARMAVVGASDRPTRLEAVEAGLTGRPVTEEAVRADAASQAHVPDDVRHGDAYASAEFRTDVLPTYVERALEAALIDAPGSVAT